jgi:putative oxidoreductase
MSIQAEEQAIINELKKLIPAQSVKDDTFADLAKFLTRGITGGFLAAHGTQKLLGWFNGPGFKGTMGFMSMMHLKPEKFWAMAAGASELGGGALSSLGLFYPLGPIMSIGAMGIAAGTIHSKKPIWITDGGAETPLTLAVLNAALALTGPGKFSLDRMLGIRVPRAISVLAFLAVVGSVASGIQQYHAAQAEAAAQAENEAQASATTQN